MTTRIVWTFCALLVSVSLAAPRPPQPAWEPKVHVDAFYYFDPKNAEHRRASPYGDYWKQMFTGQLGSPAEILLVSETWDVERPDRDSSGPQPLTETYSVLVHLRAYGERIKIEATESAPLGGRNRAITVQRAILQVARQAERHLKELRKKHGEKDVAGSVPGRR